MASDLAKSRPPMITKPVFNTFQRRVISQSNQTSERRWPSAFLTDRIQT